MDGETNEPPFASKVLLGQHFRQRTEARDDYTVCLANVIRFSRHADHRPVAGIVEQSRHITIHHRTAPIGSRRSGRPTAIQGELP